MALIVVVGHHMRRCRLDHNTRQSTTRKEDGLREGMGSTPLEVLSNCISSSTFALMVDKLLALGSLDRNFLCKRADLRFLSRRLHTMRRNYVQSAQPLKASSALPAFTQGKRNHGHLSSFIIISHYYHIPVIIGTPRNQKVRNLNVTTAKMPLSAQP